MSGSTVTVQSNAIVRFQSAGLALDRGSVSVGTGQKLVVFARDFQITPTSSDWTQFEVARSAGLIHIAARKNSVSIACGMGAPTIVQEGHEITRADAQNCGMPSDSQSGAAVAAKGPILNSLWAVGLGAGGAAAAITTYTLMNQDEPISPDKP
jgi:ferric-dicitrate binding protein FerR (iron transport regulator)